MSDLNFSYSSALPFHPEHLCFGWDSNKRFLSERRFNHALFKAQSNLLSLANQYIDSYAFEPAPTLLHYRDRLLGRALTLLLYNCQFVDLNCNQMTSHTQRLWSLVPYEQLWTGVDIDPSASYNYRYGGPLGSLAFHLLPLDLEGDYPLDVVRKLLDYLWALLGRLYNTYSPADRHRYVLDQIGLPLELISQLSAAALYLLSTSSEVVGNVYRQQLRQWLVGPNDARSLPARILLGEFNDKLLEITTEYLDLDPEPIIRAQHVITSILAPVGLPQLYSLFELEGLYRSALYISSLEPSLTSLQLEYLTAGQSSEHQEIAANIAQSLVLSCDAARVLSLYNTFNNSAKDYQYYLSETLYWMRTARLTSIADNHPHRLSYFNQYLDNGS